MSQVVLGLLRASHPEPAIAVTSVSALLAWGVGHPPAGVAAVALTVLASQLSIGWVNDAVDADRDAAVGRRDKPVARGEIGRRTVAVAGCLAAVATVLLAAPLGPVATGWAAVALGSALLYDWPVKFTPASVLPYIVSFGALPAFVVAALPGDGPAPPVWLITAGALLGAGAHFANVLPDLADDAHTGVRGLPHRLGPGWSATITAGLLFTATATLVLGPPGAPSKFGLTAAVAAAVILPAGWHLSRTASARGGRPVAAFRSVMLIAMIDVMLLVAGGRTV